MMRMRAYNDFKVPKVSIKDRIGFQSRNQNNIGIGGLTTKKFQNKGISDARQKINLNRIQKGKVSDARQRIEAKRKQKYSGAIKSLRITAVTSPPRRQLHGMPPDQRLIQAAMEGLTYSDSIGHMRSSPLVRRAVPRNFGNNMKITRSVSPAQITRTVRNNAVSNIGGSRIAQNPRFYDFNHRRREESPVRMGGSIHLQSSTPHSNSMDSSSLSENKVTVCNLQPSVSSDDIIELFSDIGEIFSAKLCSPGRAEVIYVHRADAMRAVDAYHNRFFDGAPMRVMMESDLANSSTGSTLKSATGASMKLPKGSYSIRVEPDITAIHKVLFSTGSSSVGTRDLFKGKQ